MVKYYKGDLLASNCNIICHQCNCKGVMGAGIAKTIRENYPQAYHALIDRYNSGEARLGEIDIAAGSMRYNQMRYIINMYSQDTYAARGICHTKYDAFQECLNKIKTFVDDNTDPLFPKAIVVGFPAKIGCGLAGGDWNIVRQMIEDTFEDSKYNVEIWEL